MVKMAEGSGNEDLFDSIVMADERWILFTLQPLRVGSQFVVHLKIEKPEKSLFWCNKLQSFTGYVFCSERFYTAY